MHSPYYLPPLAARRLAVLLATLPEWWKQEGDAILALPLSGKVEDAETPNWEPIERIAPWGWNAQIVHFLKGLGAPERLLPTPERLETLRVLSSRRTTVQLLHWLNEQPPIAGVMQAESRWCSNMEEVDKAVNDFGQRAMLKLPWSSSGRGVFSTRLGYDLPCRHRAERGVRRYGGIEVQQLFMEGEDGALEWEVRENGDVVFLGCSLFHTTVGGAYLGHQVDTPMQLQARFFERWTTRCTSFSHDSFTQLIERLSLGIQTWIAPHYTGPLGIDVLFTPEGLHPCIEVNLRRTMGHVALAMAERLPATQLPSRFFINGQGLQLQTI